MAAEMTALFILEQAAEQSSPTLQRAKPRESQRACEWEFVRTLPQNVTAR